MGLFHAQADTSSARLVRSILWRWYRLQKAFGKHTAKLLDHASSAMSICLENADTVRVDAR